MSEETGIPSALPSEKTASVVAERPEAAVPPRDGGDWRDAVPPALKKAAGKFTSPAEVLKSYVALERRLGRAVVLPADDAGPEEIAQFNRRLGVPAEPEDYRLELPASLAGEGSEAGGPSALTRRFLADMHAAGARPAEVQAAMDWYAREVDNLRLERTAARGQAKARAETELRREWGGDFDRNIALAERAVQRFAAGETEALTSLELRDEQTLGNHPAFLRLLARIGAAVAEDPVLITEGAPAPGDLKSRIDELHSLSPAAYKSAAVQAELGSLYRELHEPEGHSRVDPA